MVIEHYDEEPLDFVVEEYAAVHPFTYRAEEGADLAPLLSMAWPEDRALVDRWLHGLSLGSRKVETFALLDQLNRAICRDFRYQAREEPGVQSPAQTLSRGSGSCRDFAALFLDACRHLGARESLRQRNTTPAMRANPAQARPTRGQRCTCRDRAGRVSTPLLES